ncbi:DUF2634 domain-containing protein [Cellulosilyticum sp. ST5]|uniref:DUF2634 domain-containing protein n=1 Tax=unclassified Cellulosilyticum TaxID=2643091 RepID=UPI000F8C823B|nr:DUF2634 domain-containing protein [Cellulosilyticum sp. WCF-2]QEH69910.1 DUF2634 domain-containing protein [Cellulosilyticum sp. WCF-2]
MIPTVNDDLLADIEIAEQPSLTYEVKIDKDKMGNYVDGIDAIKQAIYHIINTERYQYLIYSWNYGIELADLFGKPIAYCYPEIKRRITEALLQDDRIESVNSFEFSYSKGDVIAKFKVITTEGEIEIDKVVRIG